MMAVVAQPSRMPPKWRVGSALPVADNVEMTDDDRDLLQFEEEWWGGLPGRKEEAIRDRFDISATRYYQRLNRLVDMVDAIAEFPLLTRRIRDRRTERTAARQTRTVGGI